MTGGLRIAEADYPTTLEALEIRWSRVRVLAGPPAQMFAALAC
jgi:hypothetical protein